MTRSSFLVLACLLLAPAGARAKEGPGASEAERQAPAAREDGRRTLHRFPVNLLRGTVGVFHGDNLAPLLVAGATLGYIVGRTVVRVNGRPLEKPKGPHVSFNPVVGRRTRALLVGVAF